MVNHGKNGKGIRSRWYPGILANRERTSVSPVPLLGEDHNLHRPPIPSEEREDVVFLFLSDPVSIFKRNLFQLLDHLGNEADRRQDAGGIGTHGGNRLQHGSQSAIEYACAGNRQMLLEFFLFLVVGGRLAIPSEDPDGSQRERIAEAFGLFVLLGNDLHRGLEPVPVDRREKKPYVPQRRRLSFFPLFLRKGLKYNLREKTPFYFKRRRRRVPRLLS